jgi:hypothetical protein
MGIFDFLKGADKKPKFKGFQDPKWARTDKGSFHRLSMINPDRSSMRGSGIVVVWHGGVKPTWLIVKSTDNISATVEQFVADEEIGSFENRGGVFVTWSFIQKQFQPGVAKYLIHTMKPELNREVPSTKADPVPVYLPGAKVDEGPKQRGPGL